MALKVEGVVGGSMHAEKTLGGSSRFLPLHFATSILSSGTEQIVESALPMRRLGSPPEVANTIFFLCSLAASYINGAEIHINGGQHI